MTNKVKKKVLTPDKLNKELEYYTSKGATVLDAILTYAQSNSIDIESIALLVKKSTTLKERLRIEGEKTFLIKLSKED